MPSSINDSQPNGMLPRQSGDLEWNILSLTIDGVSLEVSTVRRDGPLDPIVFCHGFGSTKEDYLDVSLISSLADLPFIAYDTPGSGQSKMSDLTKLSIPFLVTVLEEVLRHHGIKKFHLLGHSMGGLTGVMLAKKHPNAVLSFTNIKGNLAPEDCFLSRQVLSHPCECPQDFINQFIDRTRKTQQFGNALYAASLPAKVQPGAVRPTFESLVYLSDNEDLLDTFFSLPCPRMFMYGEQYASLSYLPRLAEAGVELAEISHAGHFIMYSNPVEMWSRISAFLKRIGGLDEKMHV